MQEVVGPSSGARNQVALDEYLPAIKRKEYVLADFYCLAVTLVSSILQLGETPWLDQPWSRQNIAFLRLKSDEDLSVDIKHPYLTCQYYGPKNNPPSKSVAHVPTPGQMNMLALAIMLLELNCGTPIENLRKDEDLGPDGKPNIGTDLTTVQRWLDVQMRLGDLTSGFRNAITYCLQCYLDPTASLEDTEFLQSVEDRVLEPLEREMQLLLWG